MTVSSMPLYSIETRDNSGDLVSILENAHNVNYSKEINSPQRLSFELPADDSKLGDVVLANELWLRDNRTGNLVRKFLLNRQIDIRKGSELTTEIEAFDLLSQLGKESILDYSATTKTVNNIIDDFIALQVLTPAITKGTIDAGYAALTRSIDASGNTILFWLLALRETVGGYIEVDKDRKLNWASSIGEDKGQQIRYRKNLIGIEREVDYPNLANRIYAYGQGEGGARVELAPPGYVEDAASQAAWGGIYVKPFIDISITDVASLTAWANKLLDEYKNPPIYYRIDALDLSKRQDIDFSFDELQLGSTIKVIDENLGIDVETQVISIEYPDLLNPQAVRHGVEAKIRLGTGGGGEPIPPPADDIISPWDPRKVGIWESYKYATHYIDADHVDETGARKWAGATGADFIKATDTLDDVQDGATYKRPKATALTAGEVDLSKAGVINKVLSNIADDASYEKTTPTEKAGAAQAYTDLPAWDKFFSYFTSFESLDGLDVGTAATGSVNLDGYRLELQTGLTLASTVFVKEVPYLGTGQPSFFTWAKDRRFRTYAEFVQNTDQEIWITTGFGNQIQPTEKHFGFKVIDNVLYGTTGDGAAESTLNCGTFNMGDQFDLEARFISGTSVEFFVNEVSKGTITTHLPSGGAVADRPAYIFHFFIINSAAANKVLRVAYWELQQKR